MRALFIAAVLMTISLSAHAQETCQNTETVQACFSRMIVQARGFSAEVVKVENQKAAEQSQPGAQSGGGQVNSTVTDLIPWLDMLGVLSDADANDGTIAADLNFLIPGLGEPAIHNTQLKWVLDISPEPFTPLIEAYPEAIRAPRKTELTGKLNQTADSELQLTWSRVTERLGRDFRRHHDSMRTIMAPAIVESLKARDPSARAAFLAEFGDLIADAPIGEMLGPNPLDTPFDDPVFDAAPELREQLKRLVSRHGAELGAAQKQVAVVVRTRLAATGLDQLSDLVLRQPQLLFTATRRFRDELVGPDAFGAKVTYEHSFANYSGFLGKAGASCQSSKLSPNGSAGSLADAAECYAALSNYLEDHAETLEAEDRISFSLEYRKVSAVNIVIPEDSVSLAIPKTNRMIGSLGYGRVLPRGAAKDRVDFKADYDSNVSGKAGGKSRVIASITYTRKIAGMDVPFGIVYANKSEFLEGVDKQVSLHVGVKFKAPAAME